RFPVKPTFFMQGRGADGYPRLNLRAAVWRRGLEARGHLIKPPRELTKLMLHRIFDCVSKSPTKELLSIERRGATRFPLQLTARITAVGREPADISARTANISRIGVLLLSARPFQVNTHLEFVVNLHAELRLRLFFRGKVTWVQPIEPHLTCPG